MTEWNILDAELVAAAFEEIARHFQKRTTNPTNAASVGMLARKMRSTKSLPPYALVKPEIARRLKAIMRDARTAQAEGNPVVIDQLVHVHGGNGVVGKAGATLALERAGVIELPPLDQHSKAGRIFAVLIGERGNSLLHLSSHEILVRLKSELGLESPRPLHEALRRLPADKAALFTAGANARKSGKLADVRANPLEATPFFQRAKSNITITLVLHRFGERRPPITTQRELINAIKPLYGADAAKAEEDAGQVLSTICRPNSFDRVITAMATLTNLNETETGEFHSAAESLVRIVRYRTSERMRRIDSGLAANETHVDRRRSGARVPRVKAEARNDASTDEIPTRIISKAERGGPRDQYIPILDAAYFNQRLERMLRDTQAAQQRISAELRPLKQELSKSDDQAIPAADQMRSLSSELIEQRRAAIRIMDAMTRMRQGFFGICARLGTPIPLEELQADPIALRSTEGQRIHDKGRRRAGLVGRNPDTILGPSG